MAKPPKAKSKTAAGWRCPDCGRKFARARQAHSCQVVPLSAHLTRVPSETRAIYDRIKVSSPVEVDAELKGWIAEAYQVGEMAGRRV